MHTFCLLSALASATTAFSLSTFSAQRTNNNAFLANHLKKPLHYHATILKSSPLQELESTNSSSEWVDVLARDGVIKIDSLLSPDLSDAFRYYVEDQKILAWFAGMEGEEIAASRVFYGPRQSETLCDLQLSILRGGFAGDNAKNVTDSERHILADVLQEVVGPSGSLSPLLDELVTTEGELYEMAAVVTDQGNEVEEGKVLSLCPGTTSVPPMYTIIFALEDINANMGPITFFLNSHVSGESADDSSRLSTMKKGDAIIFDAPMLLSYSSNDAQYSLVSTFLKMSFRNPAFKGDLEFSGSLRPGYSDAINVGDLRGALVAYGNGDGNSFNKYGDGIKQQFLNTKATDDI